MKTYRLDYKKFIAVVVWGFLTLTLSCELESFKNDSGNREDMVLSSIIEAGTPIHAYVNEYQHFADTMEHIKYIENASISLYENDIYVGDFLCFKDTFQGEIVYGLPEFIPSSGNTYTLVARAGDMEVAGSTSLPPPVLVEKVDSYSELVNPDRNLYRQNFEITFQDPPGNKNFYIITLESAYGDSNSSNFLGRNRSLDSDDPIIEGEVSSELYFSDRSIDGVRVTISLYTIKYWHPYNDKLKYQVNLRSVSREYYEYCKALDTYESTREDYYAEPASVYTNINNGWGAVIGFSSSYSDSVVFRR